MGIAACLALLHYVFFERNYDSFHQHSEQIYRVKTDSVRNGEVVFDAADNFAGVGPALVREVPEVIASAIGLPLAILSSTKWLENYAHRISISWWFFVLPVIFMVLIAFFLSVTNPYRRHWQIQLKL